MTSVRISLEIAMALAVLWMARRAAKEGRMRKDEQAQREELEAYARLDTALGSHELPRELAKRVCATVSQVSVFRQVALLLRDSESRLNVVGSAGVDDLMALAINGWVARFARENRRWSRQHERRASYRAMVGSAATFDGKLTSNQSLCRQVMVLPLWSQAGEMLGAIAVWTGADAGLVLGGGVEPSKRELATLEILAQKLARSLDVELMSEQLLRAEKLGGLGNLAKGLARELNQPLTAVLGFAELIAETTTEARVREDAVAIVGEAMRMRDAVDTLFKFWCPALSAEAVATRLARTLKDSRKRVEVRA